MNNNHKSLEQTYDEVRDRIFEKLESEYINQKKFAEIVGVSAQTITDWKTGKSRSFAKKLKPISYALGVSVGYLLGEPDSPALDPSISFDDFTYAMQSEARDLTEADKALLLSMARQLNEARKKRNGETD